MFTTRSYNSNNTFTCITRIKCLWKQFSSSSLSTDVSHQMLLNSKAKSSNSVNKVSICSGTSILYVICVVLSHQLIALQDDELYAGKKSIDPNAGDLEKILEILKDSIYHLTWITPVLLLPFTDVVDNLSQTRYWNDPLLSHRFRRIALLQAVTRLYNHLSIRNERRGYILSSVGDALSRSTYLPPLQWTWDLARHAGAVRSDVYQPRTGVNGFITGNY